MEAAAFFLGVIAFLAALAAVKIGCVGIALWHHLAAPRRTARIAGLYVDRPKRCLLVGLINLLVLAFLTLVLLNTVPLRLIGLLLLALLIALATLAYGPAYHLAARRLLPGADEPLTCRDLLHGALAAEAAYLAPAIGQALSLATLVRGAGAVILAHLGGGGREEEQTP